MSPAPVYNPQAVLAQQDMHAIDTVKSLDIDFSPHYPNTTQPSLPQALGSQATDMRDLSTTWNSYAQNCIPNGCMDSCLLQWAWPQASGFQAADIWDVNGIWDPCAHNYPKMFMVALPVNQPMAQMVPVVMPHMQLEMAPELHGVRDFLEARPSAPLSIHGNVWRLARDPAGTRAVQQAFHDATSNDHRVDLALELHTHVWEALKCPQANHVIQKCISTLPAIDSQFIIDELLRVGHGSIAKAAKHRYGCRILQRLFEHCSSAQLSTIRHDLLIDAVSLCGHNFAKYVMQHLLEFGTSSDISRLTDILATNVSTLAADGSGCAVLDSALKHSSGPSQACLVQELLSDPGLFADMACSRHGQLAAKFALELADPPHKWVAMNRLSDQKEKLQNSRYGRVLFSCMQKVVTFNSWREGTDFKADDRNRDVPQ